jgi:hypothetical protein
MKKYPLITLLLTTLVLAGCVNNVTKDQNVYQSPNNDMDLVISNNDQVINQGDNYDVKVVSLTNIDDTITKYNINELGLLILLDNIYCSEFEKINLSVNSLINYCEDSYGGIIINGNNLLLEISKSNDDIFIDNDLEYLKSLFPSTDTNFLSKVSDSYNQFINNSDLYKYKISFFLMDSLGKDEIARFYLTENLNNITESELYYWNICEAGCPIYSKKIVGNYIVWQWGLNPTTGAGDMCLNVMKPYEKYTGDKQIKCEIIDNIDRIIRSKVVFHLFD